MVHAVMTCCGASDAARCAPTPQSVRRVTLQRIRHLKTSTPGCCTSDMLRNPHARQCPARRYVSTACISGCMCRMPLRHLQLSNLDNSAAAGHHTRLHRVVAGASSGNSDARSCNRSGGGGVMSALGRLQKLVESQVQCVEPVPCGGCESHTHTHTPCTNVCFSFLVLWPGVQSACLDATDWSGGTVFLKS